MKAPPPVWLIECKRAEGWVLTLAPQKTGICATCKKTIFNNLKHRA